LSNHCEISFAVHFINRQQGKCSFIINSAIDWASQSTKTVKPS